ncbi:ABC transporter ATP-binding protein [Diaminobutyricibacter tongyongensis]|uniref:ABC transporter ATP-binding protein n=2 Tax=Leifsonia tongyongensis TaxID=1268043 RepID=A0A6L9XWR7_9MICO|nr:ABC transporter ATP-binding protein [Diaminobutyricibacter tongyongensis]
MTEGMTLRGVGRSYRGGAGVRDLDLEVRPGEVHALVGLNGAGKSTLMKLLLGMLRPDIGTVSVGSVDIRNARPELWARVGQVVETPLAYPEFTVTQNLLAAARLRGVASAVRTTMVDDAIDGFRLADFAGNRTRTLSSGNRQRLGLAAALQHHPDFVVLDEPTSFLDPAGTILLREILRNRALAGAAVLVSSHHLDEVARIADRITVMNAGRLIGGLDPGGTELERSFFDLVLHDDEKRGAPAGRFA